MTGVQTCALPIYYGQGCLANLPSEVDRLGASRVFIITGHSLKEQGTLLGRIQDLLGDRCAGVFAETRQHVPRETVLAATRAAQKVDADLLISFGGGTPNDTAKLVALCLAENITSTDQLDRYRIRFQYPDKLDVPTPTNPCLPHISIPLLCLPGSSPTSPALPTLTARSKTFIPARTCGSRRPS